MRAIFRRIYWHPSIALILFSDAGTVYAGIDKAIANKVFGVPAFEVLQKYIKGYLISHAHLDHVSGLIITSPADAAKTVYATKECMQSFFPKRF